MRYALLGVVVLSLSGCCTFFGTCEVSPLQAIADRAAAICQPFDYQPHTLSSTRVTMARQLKAALGITGPWAVLVPDAIGGDFERASAAAFEEQAIAGTWHKYVCYYRHLTPAAAPLEELFNDQANVYLSSVNAAYIEGTNTASRREALRRRGEAQLAAIRDNPSFRQRLGVPASALADYDVVVPKTNFTDGWSLRTEVGFVGNQVSVCGGLGQRLAAGLSGSTLYAMKAMGQQLREFSADDQMSVRDLLLRLVQELYFMGAESFDPGKGDPSPVTMEQVSCLLQQPGAGTARATAAVTAPQATAPTTTLPTTPSSAPAPL